MKKSILIISIGIIIFTSCRKEDSNPITPTNQQKSVLDYFPLNTGNYWVYKQSEYDSLGNIRPHTYANDSIVVKNDTIINNKTYHTIIEYNFLGSPNSHNHYYRDSANYIVDNNGNIILSVTPGFIHKQVIAFNLDTISYVNYSFIDQTTSITVPLGTYNCVDVRGEIFRKTDNFSIAHLTHNYYYKNIGSVKKVLRFVESLGFIELELVNYNVQ